jgi:hypothetical protein
MMQDMQPDKAGEQVVELHCPDSCESAPIAIDDIGNRYYSQAFPAVVCTENLSSGVAVMKSAQDGA